MAPPQGEVVGRDDELATVRAFLETEGFGALVLEGEAGIGKTTLWRQAVADASTDGAPALVAAPSASEATFAFSGLTDLLGETLADTLAELPPPQALALETALQLREPEGPPPELRTVAAAVLGVLRALAGDTVVVVAIDDVQWLDRESATALEYAFRRLDEEPVRLIAAVRVGSDVRRPALLDGMPSQRVTTVVVGPLSTGALHRAIRLHLNRVLPRPVLQRIHELAGGNPFYALELARSLPDDPRPGDELPASLEGLTRQRLTRLPGPVRRVLEPAALLAEPTVARLEALSSEPDLLGARLDRAAVADVIEVSGENVRFTHPLLAAGMAAMIGPRRRSHLHRQLADLIEEPEERARHLALATTAADAVVADEIENGARAALSRGARAAAAELLESAADLTPRGQASERWRRTIEAAYAYDAADLPERSRLLLEQCLPKVPAGATRADALVALSRVLDTDYRAVDDMLEEALLHARGDDARISAINRERASASFVSDGDVRSGLEHLRAALAAAERANDPAFLIPALSQIAFYETMHGRITPGLLERALDEQRRAAIPVSYFDSPTFVLGLRYVLVDRLDEARELLEIEAAGNSSRGNDYAYAGDILHLVELECRAGNFDVAAAHANDLLERQEQRGEEHQGGVSLYAKALVDAHLGRVADARTAAKRGAALSRDIGDQIFLVQNLAVLGFLELSLGDAVRADAALRRLPPALVQYGWDEPSICPAWPNAIEALVRIGELDLAREYLDLYEERARRCDCPWALATSARCAGLLHLAAGDLDQALASFEHALREHVRTPGPFERGRTLLALGEARRRGRQRRAAREAFGEALRIFERLGTRLWAENARAQIARIGGRAPSRGRADAHRATCHGAGGGGEDEP